MKRKTSSFIPRILLLAGVISLPFFLTGCEGNSDEEDDLDYASLTNQQAQTENQQSTQSSSQPSQAPTKTQFVAEGVADARGTWYKHGSTGGW